MSTEKRKWNYGVRDDESIWVTNGSEPTSDHCAFDMTCDKATAKQIVDSLNACTGLSDPQAALDAAREALKGYAQCSDGCTCGDGWSHEPAIEALKLLNQKASC